MTQTPVSTPAPDPDTGARVAAEDRAHVFHSWSAQARISPMAVAGASGSHFWDYEGTRYLDFSSGLVHANLGYQHPRMVAAVQEAAARQCTLAPGFADEARSTAARMVAERAPGDLDQVFFTNGGAEATENAMRMARLHTGRQKVLTTYRSYHGATAGAITATGEPRRWGSEPGVPGIVHFWGPYPFRSPFHSTSPEQECERALQHLRDVLMVEGPQSVAAVMLETVVGTNGVLVPPDGYLAGVREICDEHGILWIADEVMAGFGRCGEWFAVDRWGQVPDLVCFAKGVNSGYVPLGGVVISPAVAATFAERPYPGGLTYSGHPLACASAVASMTVFEEEDVLGHVRRMADEVLAPRLAEIADRHVSVGEVRGLGMFWALDLVADPATNAPLVPYNASGPDAAPMADLVAACKEQGLWPMTHFNRIHVVPPLVTTADELAAGLDMLDRALAAADAHVARTRP